MKKIILAFAILATLTGCKSQQAALDEQRAEISRSAFCTVRGYAYDDNTYQATNEYLDTWCGSVEEETALIEAGVEPY